MSIYKEHSVSIISVNRIQCVYELFHSRGTTTRNMLFMLHSPL